MSLFTAQAGVPGGNHKEPIHQALQSQDHLWPVSPGPQGSWSNTSRDELGLVPAQAAMPTSAGSRLSIFPRRGSRETWHRQLLASGADQCINGTQPFHSFPFGTLSSATDVYISKKKLVPDTQECDAKLVDMVLEHARRDGGVKDVAILACLHALSHSAGSTMLISLREECAKLMANPRFLKCLILSHYANGTLIHESERRASEALIQALSGRDLIGAVRQLLKSLAEESANPSILDASYINSILTTARFGETFQAHVDSLHRERRYMSLYNSVSWLTQLASLPETSTARGVIRTILPQWRFWTAWRPNYLRLIQWEGGNFTEAQREDLHHIFDLEGPDTTGYYRATLKESFPACLEFVQVANEDPTLLERLLKLLDDAQLVYGRHAVDLFIFLCVKNSNPVDDDVLSLVQSIIDTRNDSCIYAMHLWLSNLAGFNNRMVALTKMLPVLEFHVVLQDLVGHDIGSDVVEVMHAAQAEYVDVLRADPAENLATKIHEFGLAILATAWLQPSLPQEFLEGLRRLPPPETIHEILDYLKLPHAPADLIRQYLSVVIGGQDGDANAMLRSIQSNSGTWGRGVDPDRSHLAMAIRNLGYVDAEVHDACLRQIPVEDSFFVRDLLPVTRGDNNGSCVDFAALLARRAQMRCRIHDCWYGLLFALLQERADDILVWTAEELTVDEWFRWVRDLRLLFPHADGQLSASDLGFTPRKYDWWDLLAARYRDAITQLEALHRRQGNLRWLWFQELPDIVTLLDALMRDRETHSPFERFILSFLQPVPYITRLVCASLSAVNSATPEGRMAFESIHARHKQGLSGGWSPSAIEALMISFRRSREISTNDRDGLEILSELLGFGTSVDEDGIRLAQRSLLSDYDKLIAAARELEDMRLKLRGNDASGASAFLEELGVEDGRPGSDPVIPDRLNGSVERVGQRQWEMCFPLVHLDAQTKQALGVNDTSRLLLVRISFLRQQPAFCIHFYPNDEGTDRSHGLWYVNGEMPDGRVCWTTPTLLGYLLGRALCSFLSRGHRELAAIHDMITAVLREPAAHCVFCSRVIGCKAWRPTVCSTGCGEAFQRAPLEVRACGLISDPPVLDLLLTSLYAAAKNPSMTMDLLPDCPFERDRLCEVINSFPALPPNARALEILSQIRAGADDNSLTSDRESLLTWMSVHFRGCLVSAPKGSQIPGMPGVMQFLMLNGDPDRERAFAGHMAAPSPSNAARGRVGGVVFHGATVERLWRALAEGLKATMHGRPGLQVKGISLADEAAMVLGSCGDTNAGRWRRSGLQNRSVMLVCELAGHSWQGYHSVSDDSRVVLRYVLLCPKNFTAPPPTSAIGDGIRRTFLELKEGVLREEAEVQTPTPAPKGRTAAS